MTVSLGRSVAALAEPGEQIPTELVGLINRNVRPPSELSSDDVFIRAMHVVSDEVNSFGGRFPVDEHERLEHLLVDCPVMIGHRKDRLPVGRVFHATRVEREGRPWVKAYFYWLKAGDRAEELRANLDGGIYKECSLAFTFLLPECSVCGQDIRRCRHQPFESYDHDGVSESCHFNYRQIERVLETSLVYRGAVPDTSITKDMEDAGAVRESVVESLPRTSVPLTSLAELDHNDLYLVVPHYDGLDVTARQKGRGIELLDAAGFVIYRTEPGNRSQLRGERTMSGVLVGLRGKERCGLDQLQAHLQGDSSPVTRLVLYLYPQQGIVVPPRLQTRSPLEIRVLPHRVSERDHLDTAAREVTTRDGVDILPLNSLNNPDRTSPGSSYRYCPSSSASNISTELEITLELGNSVGRLSLSWMSTSGQLSGLPPVLDLPGFDLAALMAGRRFLARASKAGSLPNDAKIISGQLHGPQRIGDGFMFDATGELAGRYVVRPARWKGQECYLFSRLSGSTGAGSAV